MVQKAFLEGDGYHENDTVVLQEKQYIIEKIKGGVATIVHRDGTGEETKQNIKLSDLPQKKVTVKPSPAEVDELVETPTYEDGEKLANGWVVIRASVRGKYMVRNNGSQNEMAAIAIAAAVRDFEERRAEKEEEDRIHAEAEKYARARMMARYGGEDAVEKTPSVTPETKAKTPSKVDMMAEVLTKLNDVAESVKRINSIEKRLADQMAELEEKLTHQMAQVADRYDERLRKLEKAMETPTDAMAAPKHTPPTPPQFDIKTLVQKSDGGWDKSVEAMFNEGWRVLNWKVIDEKSRVVTLIRYKDEAEEIDDGEARKVLSLPGLKPRTVEGIVVDDVTEKYAGMSGTAAEMARSWDAELERNTLHIMGGTWYDRRTAG